MKEIRIIKWDKVERLLEKIYGRKKPSIYEVSDKEKLFITGLWEEREIIKIPLKRERHNCIHYDSGEGYESHASCNKYGYFKICITCKEYKERYIQVK